MHTIKFVKPAGIRFGILSAALLMLTGCMFFVFGESVTIGDHSTGGALGGGAVDLTLFIEKAQAATCADIHNRLYLIDGELVFSDIAGNCADASYSQILYGSTPDEVLCRAHDSIAGPMKSCEDTSYQALFDTITTNLDRPDLGLGDAHSVEPIAF
jgi:hypothetical protein